MTRSNFPLPPPDLMRLSVSWADDERFIARGISSFNKVISAFELAGQNPKKTQKLLEWGCGCGRMTRHAIEQGYDVYGVDINSEAITWNQNNLSEDRFSLCSLTPPLPFDDNHFDFVYAGSVITHISIENQFSWMRELSRVIKPGGMLLLTFMGSFYFRKYFGRDSIVIRALNTQPFLEAGTGKESSNEFGIAQTVETLDELLFDFSRKIHIQVDDILGGQDTAVFQKDKGISQTSVNKAEHIAVLLRGSNFVPRNTLITLGDLKIQCEINGGIPDQLYIQIIRNSSKNIKEVQNTKDANTPFELLNFIPISGFQEH